MTRFNPFVTVVIPAYNAEKYISETLDSIFLQETTFPFLVHVFDDCSIDSTVQICQEYNEKYENFYLTIHPKNIGMSKNQHFAISNAYTKYTAYIDSDDLYSSTNFLQNQIDFLNENPTVSCVFCNVSSFDENLKTTEIRFEQDKKPPKLFNLHYFFKNIIPITNSSMVFKQEFNNTLPFFYTDYFQFDWLLHIHHGLNGDFGYNDFVGTRYRIHETNATNIKFAESKIKDAIKLNYVLKKNLPDEYKVYFTHPRHQINSLALFYFRYNKYIKFLKWYVLWLRLTPIKSINFREQFWLLRYAFFKRTD